MRVHPTSGRSRQTFSSLGGSTPAPQSWRRDALSTVEHRPADVVPQPLVVEYELANRLRELLALPPAFESPCAVALYFRRGDVWDDRRLAGSERGMACCPTHVSGRGHCMATRRASLGHFDLAARPGAGLLNRLTRSRVLRPTRLEPVEDVLRARCRPQGEELVIRIGEGPTAADGHETRVAVFREDHTQQPFCSHLPNALHDAPAPSFSLLERSVPLRLAAPRIAKVLLKLVVLLVVRAVCVGTRSVRRGRFCIQNLEPTAGFEPATRCLHKSGGN